MNTIVLEQLDRFGPDRCDRLAEPEAMAYVHDLATGHYENFSVISRFVPRRLRNDFAAVYAFCRWADDLGDETGDPARSLELLAWWRDELRACYADQPRHPVFVALARTIGRHDLPPQPFDHLIDAFEQDQRITRYQTWDQLLDYCTRSADPVGRLVLYLAGYRDAQRQQLSDATCTALQLTNFYQDVRRDIIERDRVYLPADVLGDHGISHDQLVGHVRGGRPLDDDQRRAFGNAMGELIERTCPMFQRGRTLWPLVPGRVRLAIKLFSLGGESVLRGVERLGHHTIDQRISLSRRAKLGLMVKALFARPGRARGKSTA
jgi:squalene synthase HpnC